MHSQGRRGGPMRSTPASVQCQKCLKRDKLTRGPRHYSYECKASAQERPYVSRPSRSQQLRNPKLVPKLTNDALEPLQTKKGIADEEIAKRELERAQQRERQEWEDAVIRPSPTRPRLVSLSIATISSNASAKARHPSERARPPTPGQRPRSREPLRTDGRRPRGPSCSRGYSRSPSSIRGRRRPVSRDSRYSRSPSSIRGRRRPMSRGSRYSRSPSIVRGRRRPASRDSRSPQPDGVGRSYRSRDNRNHRDDRDRDSRQVQRTDMASSRDGFDAKLGWHSGLRSPGSLGKRTEERGYGNARRRRDDGTSSNGDGRRPRARQVDEPPWDRSLSPFSKRLAMTREMNGGS